MEKSKCSFRGNLKITLEKHYISVKDLQNSGKLEEQKLIWITSTAISAKLLQYLNKHSLRLVLQLVQV